MLILSSSDKQNISNMLPTATKYCSFPDTYSPEKIQQFMKIDLSCSLKNQIHNDFIEAFKAKDENKKAALGFIKSKITEAEKLNKNSEIGNEDVLNVLLYNIKQRKQSINEFEKAGRIDLVEKEMMQLKCLEIYLPSQLSDEEIRNNVKSLLCEVPDGNPNKQLGLITGKMNSKFKGQFDNVKLMQIIKELM